MEPDNLVLQPRDVRFDWSTLPMHWVPDEPVATHVMNCAAAGYPWTRPPTGRHSTRSGLPAVGRHRAGRGVELLRLDVD